MKNRDKYYVQIGNLAETSLKLYPFIKEPKSKKKKYKKHWALFKYKDRYQTKLFVETFTHTLTTMVSDELYNALIYGQDYEEQRQI